MQDRFLNVGRQVQLGVRSWSMDGGSHRPDATMSVEEVCDQARQLIRNKAQRLSRRPTFTASDVEDIQQSVLLRLVTRWRALPAAKRTWAVVVRVIDQSLANQCRDREAQKRSPALEVSLSGQGSDSEETLDYAATLDAEALNRLRGVDQRCPIDALDLQLDVRDITSALDADREALCRILETETVSEASRQINRPRSTVQDGVVRLRAAFEDKGLHDYLS